jgi:hypothetical protein
MTQLAQKQEELIKLLEDQTLQVEMALYSREDIIRRRKGNLSELSMIYKMELGDDAIAEIQRLQSEIKSLQNTEL